MRNATQASLQPVAQHVANANAHAPPSGQPLTSVLRETRRSDAFTYETQRAFGGLLPLIDHPDLRDAMIQVTDGAGMLWADFGQGLGKISGWQLAPAEVTQLAVALIAAGGRHIDELTPCADVRLGDGVRVHAVLEPLSTQGTAISIRVPRMRPPTFADMLDNGLCDDTTAQQLRHAVGDHRNILISGGTGSGKTTLLSALLGLSAPHERIITIEDVAELRLRHDNWVALEARQANIEGAGQLDLDRLLREALRMRPDRLVLGECRGAELLTLLSALNTGHNGGAGTIHASGLVEVPARLEALGALGGLSPEVLARQVVSAIHLIIHVHRDSAGVHRVSTLGVPRLNGAGLVVEPLSQGDRTVRQA